jgi:RNA 3'-terminal phosphate cyclase (ATP)
LSLEIRVFNIRAGRAEPGLRPQHMTGVKAAAGLCAAELKGCEVGSTELIFRPREFRDGIFRFDVGTAGSITLVLQTIMPILPFASGDVHVEITGGTDVKWSPPIDYVGLVMLPILRKVGYRAILETLRRGHYPKGGGLVQLSTSQVSKLRPMIGKTSGSVLKIDGVSHARGLPKHVATRQAASATKQIRDAKLPNPSIVLDVKEERALLGQGSGIILYAQTVDGGILGADCLGDRGRPAEDVGLTAGKILLEEVGSGANLDRHMGDMIVPYLVLAEGASEVSISRVTKHTLTNVKVAEWLTGTKFELQGELDHPGRLRVSGIGLAS